MKRLRKIMICFILSLILQCGVLLYLDRVLLKESDEFTIESVEIPTQKAEINVEIPQSAENIEISYNGRYITYYLEDKLMITDTKKSETKQILEDTKILDMSWVPDNNTLFIVEKSSGMVKIKTYNAINGVEQEVCELCKYDRDMTFRSFMSISAEYISVKNEDVTKTYRVDIDKEVTNLDRKVEEMGSAGVFWFKDVFIYEDLANERFYRYTNGKSKRMSFDNPEKLTLLKTAGNMAYMGECSGNKNNSSKSEMKISKILYGEDDKEVSTWKTVAFPQPVESKNIYINENNEIFVNDNPSGSVKNMMTGETIKYEGKFISINDRIIFSLLDGKVKLTDVHSAK